MPAGSVSNAPIPPMPPPLATAAARLAGHAPAIGAIRIGTRSPKRWQNRAARSRADTGISSMDRSDHINEAGERLCATVPLDNSVAARAACLTKANVPCVLRCFHRLWAYSGTFTAMHAYRTHSCGALRLADAGQDARLSGWVHRKRDHGQLLFVDLRDHYGVTQCVIDVSSPLFATTDALRLESVITVTGKIVARSEDTINPNLPTGEVELVIVELTVQSLSEPLPLPVNSDADYPEDIRLTYRFLDLRRERVHANIMLRAHVIASIRRRMIEQGFTEFQTPILTADSPEGARPYYVPSRLHPGEFYALPQAPQQFKQLLMVAGFDRYFQIAPCFRDEAARADRAPGEFYQLDLEMSFVTQEDVFAAVEPVLHGIFEEFGGDRKVTKPPFPRITYDDAMLKYGSDKPDLRNPIEMAEIGEVFRGSGFAVFSSLVEKGGVVRAIPAPGAAAQPRSFFDKLNEWARAEGQGGLGYIVYEPDGPKGPIARNLEPDRAEAIRVAAGLNAGDAVFFVAGKKDTA